eukprot:5852999-Pyramimonas_sp.AAC.1
MLPFTSSYVVICLFVRARDNSVDVKCDNADVKGDIVDVKGKHVDVKGNVVDFKDNTCGNLFVCSFELETMTIMWMLRARPCGR